MDWQTAQEGVIAAVQAMSLAEVLGVGFSLLYVILAAKESIWCWPAAIVGTSVSIYVFYDSNLKAESALNIFYLLMAVYGWYEWKYGSKKQDELPISQWPFKYHIINIVVSGVLTYVLGIYLIDIGSANPFVDAFTTVFALVATFMVARKVLENWVYWIVVDAVAVYLYISRDLYLFALLSVVYTIIAIVGFVNWRRIYINENA